jgi:hypothetical protein
MLIAHALLKKKQIPHTEDIVLLLLLLCTERTYRQSSTLLYEVSVVPKKFAHTFVRIRVLEMFFKTNYGVLFIHTLK